MLEKSINQYKETGETYLRVKARPGAASTEVKGVLESDDGETYKIDVAAAPENGKANDELIKYLATAFQTKRANIDIISGAGDKIKLIKIS